jgi:hypothetical protein
MGVVSSTSEEPARGVACGYGVSAQDDKDTEINLVLSVAPEPVYDIRNVGPRSRFVVRGDAGPFIVHNCVQGIARCVVGEQMLKIAKRYKVALTVHDSVVACVPDPQVQAAYDYMENVMRWVPEWAEGLPVDCEIGTGKSYGEC